MASNIGKAMVTPRPFKKVRLGKDRFWMNIVISFTRNYISFYYTGSLMVAAQ
jgi:hypothetical protein